VFGLTSGVIKLVARDSEGAETIIGLCVSGDLVGEVPALDGLPQPTDAVAATVCEVLSLDSSELAGALDRNPAAAIEVAASLAARLRWAGDCVVERTAFTVPSRLAGRLLELADLLGTIDGGTVVLDIPLSQTDLGRMAGMCRESACKALGRFAEQGLVCYEGRRLRLLRPDLLEKVRCQGRA
jgi:CRP-like cAMP-binding protein